MIKTLFENLLLTTFRARSRIKMAATIDGWHRTGGTSMSRGQWIVAKVLVNNARTYEVWHEQHEMPMARCASFEKAKAFIAEWEKKNGCV